MGLSTDSVVFSHTQRAFVDKKTGKRLRGITRLIAKLCTRPSALDFPPFVPTGKRRAKAKPFGKTDGKRVDAAITTAIVRHNTKRPALRKKKVCSRSPEAKQFFASLAKHGLRPVRAQLVVWHETARIATAIDVVAKDSNGGTVIIEVKCGYQGTFRLKNGTVKPTRLANSPFVLACVQACVGADLYARTAQVTPTRIIVAHITRSGVRLHDVPGHILRRMNVICESIYKM